MQGSAAPPGSTGSRPAPPREPERCCTIRPLCLDDLEPLSSALAELPLMQRRGRTAASLAADWRAAMVRGERLVLAEAGRRADGLAWFLPAGTFAMGGYLRFLAVRADGQARGVGRALLSAFEAEVQVAARHAFLLVSDFNTDAQRFYERRGYQAVGRLPALVHPDVDELVYWRRLS